jgi:serine/threonine protein kinase
VKKSIKSKKRHIKGKIDLFAKTEEQKKKVKEIKAAKENVQLYTNKLMGIEYALENVVSQVDKQQLIRDKESAEGYVEKWTIRADKLATHVTSTRLNEKDGSYWIKIIEDVTWDAEEYKQYYDAFGHEFLPELIDYEIFDSYMKLKMEYIEGDPPRLIHYAAILRYLSYKIVPTLYEWSRLRKIKSKDKLPLPMIKDNRMYMHGDLKYNNFLITKNDKLYLMDINSFDWHDFNGLPSVGNTIIPTDVQDLYNDVISYLNDCVEFAGNHPDYLFLKLLTKYIK